jgi:hypothetical protein
MSPPTAKVECPHGRGKDTHESEAVAEVHVMGLMEVGKITLKEAMVKVSGLHSSRIVFPVSQTFIFIIFILSIV